MTKSINLIRSSASTQDFRKNSRINYDSLSENILLQFISVMVITPKDWRRFSNEILSIRRVWRWKD